MLEVHNVSLQFGGRVLFKDVSVTFQSDNCYGIIGANGAGKSTFLKILSGELEPNKGEVTLSNKERMSVLKQDQGAYDEYTALDTGLYGYPTFDGSPKRKRRFISKRRFYGRRWHPCFGT